MDAVHPDVFPFHGEWAGIADVVQGDDDFLEVDVTAADGTEIPLTTGIAERGVSAEDSHRAITMTPPHVFHVSMENAIAERADEFHVIDALVAQVRWIV